MCCRSTATKSSPASSDSSCSTNTDAAGAAGPHCLRPPASDAEHSKKGNGSMSDSMSAAGTAAPAREAKRMQTVAWVMSLAAVGLLFDGYDLVVYGACV